MKGSAMFYCGLLAALFRSSLSETAGISKVISEPGHYYGTYCIITHAVLSWKDRTFYYTSDQADHLKCRGPLHSVWIIRNRTSNEDLPCSRTYDIGHTFTIFYIHGSNYYHLHTDTLFPLYAATRLGEKAGELANLSQIFMPCVSDGYNRMPIIWGTAAFDYDSTYWVELSQFMALNHTYQPLNEDFLSRRENICFKTLNIGMKSYNATIPPLVRNFAKHAKSVLSVNTDVPEKPQIGIVKRVNRRRIFNAKELIRELSSVAETRLVDFVELTHREQILAVQNLTVLIGMNGAGLMNAIYLPPHAVAIQMVPYKSNLNWQFYGDLLRTRGPYLEWHNKHANLHIHNIMAGNDNGDTEVHVGELKELATLALSMAEEERKKLGEKDEL